MAHFARVNDDNIVVEVVPLGNKYCINPETGEEDEGTGQDWLIDFYYEILGPTRWIQTSYNNNFRCRYAGIGYHYIEEYDVFAPVKPFPSWILNTENYGWEAPSPEPTLEESDKEKGYYWDWNEPKLRWMLCTWDGGGEVGIAST